MNEFAGIFLASFIGSWHCAGMCGPFGSFLAKERDLAPILFYHIGRLITYTVLAVLAFLIGTPLHSDWGQKILLGVLVLWAVTLFFGIPIFRFKLPTALIKLNQKTATQSKILSGLVLGLTTTLLPCAWLYGFLLMAAAAPSLKSSILTLSSFWLGTIPALFLSHTALRRGFVWLGNRSQKISAILLLVFSILGFALHTHQKNPQSCPMHEHKQ